MDRWPPPPRLSAHYFKGHGLGNDYLVFEKGEAWTATPANVRRVCDRHRGVGGDGIVALLAPPDPSSGTALPLRMFNPDGGEFERSGNGLRILASYVATRAPDTTVLDVRVAGQEVRMILHGRSGPAHDVSVEMGRAATGPAAVGLRSDALDADGRMAHPGGGRLTVVPVSVGNPHLVVVDDRDSASGPSEEALATFGPYLSGHPALAHGANVQLARVSGPARCDAVIWERGVGRTSASGTSACAVAVAMVASGRLDPGEISVYMPGGMLTVGVDPSLAVVLRGPVEEVAEGRLLDALVATFEPAP